MNAIEFEADGVKVKAWGETNGDVHISVDEGEDFIFSPSVAFVFGAALVEIASKETDE